MVWLIDFWSVHKSKEFQDWMKSKFPSVCIIFIPANCTSVLQHVDVILQCMFKHAFKKEFYSWTCSIIKSQFERGENVKVDFWMLILKPNICAWLFQAWIHVENMSEMIFKGWEKMGLLKSFNMEFQFQAMDINTSTLLFLVTFNL